MPRSPRFGRDNDPRRPRQAGTERDAERSTEPKSYGQWLEPEDEEDDLKEFEDMTGEVAREDGQAKGNDHQPAGSDNRQEVEEREEFEDLTGEVTREGDR